MSVIETGIIIGLAFWAGWRINSWFMALTFKKILEDLKVPDHALIKLAQEQGLELEPEHKPESEDSDLPILEVRVEQHPEGLFAYRKADSFFLARGKDREELMENLVNNLTNVRVTVAKEDGAEFINPNTQRT